MVIRELFPSFSNYLKVDYKVLIFFSRFWNPGSSGMDVIDCQFFAGALTVRQGRNNNHLLGPPKWSGHIIPVRLVFSMVFPLWPLHI